MGTSRATGYLLGGLAGALALMLLVKYKKGGQEFIVDAIESLSVLPSRIADALAALGDWTKKIPENLRGVFTSAAGTAGLPAGLLEAVAYRESRFRADIIDGRTISSAGAVGIMQIVPRWHPTLGESGARDPVRAIPYAASYLRDLHRQFGAWDLALAAYNWGQGHLSNDLKDGIIGNSWPAETRAYVAEITRNAGLA